MSKFNKSHLRAIIKESIKEIIKESQNKCKQWKTANPSHYRSFTSGCCGSGGCNTISEACYGYALSAYKYQEDPCECGSYGSGVSLKEDWNPDTQSCNNATLYAANTDQCKNCAGHFALPANAGIPFTGPLSNLSGPPRLKRITAFFILFFISNYLNYIFNSFRFCFW